MSYKEFVHWKWMYEDRPFGEAALDARIVDMLIFYSNSNSKSPTPLQYFVSKDSQKNSNKVDYYEDGEALGLSMKSLKQSLEKI